MDGHECEDVVKYWNKVFLPVIAQYVSCMVKHGGPELKKIILELQEGE